MESFNSLWSKSVQITFFALSPSSLNATVVSFDTPATVSEPAQKCCTENIQPFLTSILEELMGPVSSGFTAVRSLFDEEVNEIIQDFQKTNDIMKLKEVRLKYIWSLLYYHKDLLARTWLTAVFAFPGGSVLVLGFVI